MSEPPINDVSRSSVVLMFGFFTLAPAHSKNLAQMGSFPIVQSFDNSAIDVPDFTAMN